MYESVDMGRKGRGVVALRRFSPGEVVMRDHVRLVSAEQYLALPAEARYMSYQVSLVELAVPVDFLSIEDCWMVNHSCDPNTYRTPTGWAASREIAAGDEITHDYATLWFDNVEPFEIDPCLCGSISCRGRFSGNDWQDPALQPRLMWQLPRDVQELILSGRASGLAS